MGKVCSGLLLLVLTGLNPLFGQGSKTLHLKFGNYWGNAPLELNQRIYLNEAQDSLKFETIKYYVSNLVLLRNNVKVWESPRRYFLMDAGDTGSLNVSLQIPKDLNADFIQFNLGIDSNTNAGGALPGVLDPTTGMYWTWQNGYINFKMEGSSNLVNAYQHRFQFHLGGYSFPFNALQTVSLAYNGGKVNTIGIDFQEIFGQLHLQQQAQIMSPGKAAIEVAGMVAKAFKIYP